MVDYTSLEEAVPGEKTMKVAALRISLDEMKDIQRSIPSLDPEKMLFLQKRIEEIVSASFVAGVKGTGKWFDRNDLIKREHREKDEKDYLKVKDKNPLDLRNY